MSYAELFCLSNFTFLHGASHPEELVRQAKAYDYQALAITDECSLAGVVRAHVEAEKCNFPLVIGSYFKSVDGLQFVALAPNKRAYQQLSSVISHARRRSEKGEYSLSVRDVQHLGECLFIWLPLETNIDNLSKPTLEFLEATHGRLWIGLEKHLTDTDNFDYRQVLAMSLGLPVVGCGGILMHHKKRKPLQDVLTAIRNNTTVANSGFNLQQNAERCLHPVEELNKRFPPAAIQESVVIAKKCTFSLNELRYQYPAELVPPHMSPSDYLRHLVEDGARQRWPEGTLPRVKEQIEKELAIIKELSFECYFLTVHEIVAFARSEKILCQGRGSAANSAVCFCLYITEVDPATHRLLFERFISKERNEPPDIDVDFEHSRREEVIQHIYRKFGRERAALTATVITYRSKSAIRDVGKAMGFDLATIELIGQTRSWWDTPEELPSQLKSIGLDPGNIHIRRYIYLVNELRGFPRHLSQHTGGFVISEGPLNQLVPIENASMPDRTVVQWDKDDIDALGLMKIDILALGMLSAIRRCFDLVAPLRGHYLSMASVPKEDPEVYHMLQQADSVGVFQVESRAQMSMLPRLKPACFYDLVVEVALVRPGPIQGEMVHPYLRRRMGVDPVEYPSKEVEAVLERTLGVPIFQEQVIELAMIAAGFTAGEADQLRRAMTSLRKREKLRFYQQKLTEGLLMRGYSEAFAQRLVEQINGFSAYGFPESHACSFALLVYVSAWLKYHEPAAFCCALLNSQPMGFYSPSQLVQDAKRHGVDVRPIDVCFSQWNHTLEPRPPHRQPALRLGLSLLKGFPKAAADALVSYRQAYGLNALSELMEGAGLTQADLDILAHGNALQSVVGHRYQSRWESLALQAPTPIVSFANEQDIEVNLSAPTEGQDAVEDYASQGLTLGRHPMALLRRNKKLQGCKTQREIQLLNHKRFVQVAGIVTGRQRPETATGVIFLTLEDETGNNSVVVWRDVGERFRKEVLQGRLLKIKGIVDRADRVVHIVAGEIMDFSELLGGLVVSSRDFH